MQSIVYFLLMAVGLSMDSFAVSVSIGTIIKSFEYKFVLRFVLFLGLFQSMMLIVGWLAGTGLEQYIEAVSVWVASGLLIITGSKMIYEATLMCENKSTCLPNITVIIGLAFATSIDALTVGISYSLLKYRILIPALIVAIVTLIMTLSGIYIGIRFGSLFEKKLEVLGGLILVAIGVKILLTNYLN